MLLLQLAVVLAVVVAVVLAVVVAVVLAVVVAVVLASKFYLSVSVFSNPIVYLFFNHFSFWVQNLENLEN
jgi:hypothetical protein